jgi:hypothetical protein
MRKLVLMLTLTALALTSPGAAASPGDPVHWSDDYLTKGLTLLSDPTGDFSAVICPTMSMPLEQRKAARDRLVEEAVT